MTSSSSQELALGGVPDDLSQFQALSKKYRDQISDYITLGHDAPNVSKTVTFKDIISLVQRGTSPGSIVSRTQGHEAWLNDEIINAYLELLCKDSNNRVGWQHAKGGAAPPVATLSSFAYASIMDVKFGLSSLRSSLKMRNLDGEKLLDTEHVFFPFNKNKNHWILIVLSPKLKMIGYLDSFNDPIGGRLWRIIGLLRDQLGEKFIEAEWTVYTLRKDMQRPNVTPCGVFVCTFATNLIYGFNLRTVKLEDLENKRLRLASELINGKIDPITYGNKDLSRGFPATPDYNTSQAESLSNYTPPQDWFPPSGPLRGRNIADDAEIIESISDDEQPQEPIDLTKDSPPPQQPKTPPNPTGLPTPVSKNIKRNNLATNLDPNTPPKPPKLIPGLRIGAAPNSNIPGSNRSSPEPPRIRSTPSRARSSPHPTPIVYPFEDLESKRKLQDYCKKNNGEFSDYTNFGGSGRTMEDFKDWMKHKWRESQGMRPQPKSRVRQMPEEIRDYDYGGQPLQKRLITKRGQAGFGSPPSQNLEISFRTISPHFSRRMGSGGLPLLRPYLSPIYDSEEEEVEQGGEGWEGEVGPSRGRRVGRASVPDPSPPSNFTALSDKLKRELAAEEAARVSSLSQGGPSLAVRGECVNRGIKIGWMMGEEGLNCQ